MDSSTASSNYDLFVYRARKLLTGLKANAGSKHKHTDEAVHALAKLLYQKSLLRKEIEAMLEDAKEKCRSDLW